MDQFDGKDIMEIMQEDLLRALKKPRKERRWAMAIDLKKCIGCHAGIGVLADLFFLDRAIMNLRRRQVL